jgi:hypothetical protein
MQLSLFRRPLTRVVVGATAIAASAVAASCAKGTGDNTFLTNNGSSSSAPFGGSSSSGPDFGNPGDGGAQIMIGTGCSGSTCNDFPSTPVLDSSGSGVPSNVAQMFSGTGGSSGGPCIYEPPPGAMFPQNWLRPRFFWTAGSGMNLFELTLHSDHETNDLVVYTSQTHWTMDKAMWTQLASDLQNAPITVNIRQMTGSGPSAGTSSSFLIAPAAAQGAMVFWSTKSFDNSAASTDLQGFQVGDESTSTVLTPNQVQQGVWAGPGDGGNFPSPAVLEPVQCIGCHTSTPDGLYVGFTVQWPWPNAIASVQADSGSPVGAQPPWLTTGAIANLGPNTNDQNYLGGTHVNATNNVDDVMLGIQTFSKAHYQTGDRVEIASVGASLDQPQASNGQFEQVQASGVTSQLVWIDLEWNGSGDAGNRPSAAPGATTNGGWGVLARTGGTNSAGAPRGSHDGTKIAYTSVQNATRDGRLGSGGSDGMLFAGAGQADVKIIPYNANASGPGGAGGAATSLQGASDSAYNEYFPNFAPDDSIIAFNRTAAADDMYEQPKAEVFVVPAAGGTAVSLAGNQPAACSGKTSPGVSNTWPKFAPAPAGGVVTPASDGRLYYWVTFSSTRGVDSSSGSGKVQLYVAGIAVDPASGTATTYPAIYLWNQDPTVNNLIPAWDNFAIPPATNGPPR